MGVIIPAAAVKRKTNNWKQQNAKIDEWNILTSTQTNPYSQHNFFKLPTNTTNFIYSYYHPLLDSLKNTQEKKNKNDEITVKVIQPFSFIFKL